MNFIIVAFLSNISILAGKAYAAEDTTIRASLSKGKSRKLTHLPLGFDPEQWIIPDVALVDINNADPLDINNSYLGEFVNFRNSDKVGAFEQDYTSTGAPFVIDLGSFSSLSRRLGATIVLSEIRSIWYELAPIIEEHGGIILKSSGDSLFMYFDNVSDGIIATRAMYNAVVARWQEKLTLACADFVAPEEWCARENGRDLFFNTMSSGGGYGETILIALDEKLIDAFGPAVNNAFFAGEEEAEHGETIIDEGALQRLLVEAKQEPGVFCEAEQDVLWIQGEFGIDHIITREFFDSESSQTPDFCYYTLCFDAECQIPDDETPKPIPQPTYGSAESQDM